MAEKKKGGLINRLIMGSEKSEGYARASLPSNRWELFWDILKGRFWKLVMINIMTLLFFIPLAALIFFRSVSIAGYTAACPFSQCFGIGYQAMPSLVGYSESIAVSVNMMIYLFLPIAFLIAAIGLSGGAYIIRNMVWTEGIFVANDFWRGIRQNAKQLIVVALVYSLIFYIAEVSLAMADQIIAVGAAATWLLVMSKVLTYVMLVLVSFMVMHIITMSVTYKLSYRQLIRNSFLFTIGLFPQNLFFALLCAIPFILTMFGGIFATVGYMLIIFIAPALAMLAWTDYCQWAYDKFVNDKVPGAQKNRGIYEKIKNSDSGALKQYKEQIIMAGRSSLSTKPIKPITDVDIKLAELPTSFNRGDIEKLNESRRMIYEDNEKYIEEHKNDPEFQPSEEEKMLEEEKTKREQRIAQAKKELSNRNGKPKKQ